MDEANYYAGYYGIDPNTQHNGAWDAFRHAYASAAMTQDYGSAAAHIFGDMNETRGDWTHDQPAYEKNMDLCNNSVGRDIGSDAATKDDAARRVNDALNNGGLISDPFNDPRVFDPYNPPGEGNNGGSGSGGGGGGGGGWGEGWPPGMPAPPKDPLVIDLDGDGVELISLTDSGAHFDFDGNGFAERTGWVAADDGFLFKDADSNGLVSGATELFGNHQMDGFQALAQADSNGDGRINASDENYMSLKVWQDVNGDGISTENEIRSLSELQIVEFGLERNSHSTMNAGNEIRYSGTVTLSSGVTNETAAVYFAQNPTLTRWEPPVGTVIPDEIAILPNIHGYGTLTNLDYALLGNETLHAQVEVLVLNAGRMTYAEISDDFRAILFNWAGIADGELPSRGNSVDSREVAFLEKFFGSPITDNGSVTIGARYGDVISNSFDQIASAFLLRFLSVLPVSQLAMSTV